MLFITEKLSHSLQKNYLFMQCKITWFVRICLCRLVGIRLNC